MPEKHLSYFAVLDAFNSKECPVCFLVKQQIEKYFDNLLYEDVNDIIFRREFRKNHGFCNYHSYKFLSYNDGLAISLTHRDLIVDVIEGLKSKSIKYLSKRGSDKCIVCDLAKEAEERYASVIIEYMDDEDFQSKLLSSEGLCVPHYKTLLTKMKSPPKWLTDFHLKRYKDILSRLDKYLDSCNFSLGEKCPVLTNNEKLIWQKTVKMLFGFEGRLK